MGTQIEHQYLLTYEQDGIGRYSWFESEEELNNFIEANEGSIVVTEKMHILGARTIE